MSRQEDLRDGSHERAEQERQSRDVGRLPALFRRMREVWETVDRWNDAATRFVGLDVRKEPSHASMLCVAWEIWQFLAENELIKKRAAFIRGDGPPITPELICKRLYGGKIDTDQVAVIQRQMVRLWQQGALQIPRGVQIGLGRTQQFSIKNWKRLTELAAEYNPAEIFGTSWRPAREYDPKHHLSASEK